MSEENCTNSYSIQTEITFSSLIKVREPLHFLSTFRRQPCLYLSISTD